MTGPHRRFPSRVEEPSSRWRRPIADPMQRPLAALLLITLLAACSAASPPAFYPSVVAGVRRTPPPASLAPPSLSQAPSPSIEGRPPVDPSISPISLAHPTNEARAALERCGVADGSVGLRVVRAGLVPHANDVPKYVPLPGYQLELQNDEPMWVVELGGEQTVHGGSFLASGPRPVAWVDPICIVSRQYSGFIGAGPTRLSDGTLVTPPPQPSPMLSLPTPAP